MANRSGSSWAMTAALIGVLGALALALIFIPPMLAPVDPSPTPRPSVPPITPTPSPLPVPSLPVSATRSVDWRLVPLPDPGFEPARSLVLGDRVIVVGFTAGTAAGWYSDDGGTSWAPASMPVGPDSGDAAIPFVSQLAATDNVVLALGELYDAEAGTLIESFAWTSTDRGTIWRDGVAPNAVGEIELFSLVADGDRFIGYGHDRGAMEGLGWWSSTDGAAWEALSVTGLPLDGRQLPALTSGPNGLVAAGAEGDGGVGHPSAWRSPEGERWAPTIFGRDEVGFFRLATGSPAGYLVAGQTGPDERTLSQRGMPGVWISPDGSRWANTSFPDLMGAQMGSAAMNAAGAVLVVERLTSGQDQATTTSVRFLRGGTSEVADEDLPLIGIQALGLEDRFLLIGTCASTELDVCVGPTVAVGRPVN